MESTTALYTTLLVDIEREEDFTQEDRYPQTAEGLEAFAIQQFTLPVTSSSLDKTSR